METLAKLLLAPVIAVGAIVLALVLGIMLSSGFGVNSTLLPIAIVGGGLMALYFRRNRNAVVTDTTAEQKSTLIERAPNLAGEDVVEGHGATVVIHEHLVAIHRHGVGSFLTQGLKGEKRIPFKSITAVQLKPAGPQMSGYIQFSIMGGIESGAGIFDATLDENTVMFTFEQNADFVRLRDLVEARCQRTYGTTATPALSLADEIRKLAELRDSGVLTHEEFDAQKVRLLRG